MNWNNTSVRLDRNYPGIGKIKGKLYSDSSKSQKLLQKRGCRVMGNEGT